VREVLMPRFAPRLTVALAGLLLAPAIALAYPIPPVTLWELAEQADLIVVARVATVEEAHQEEAEPFDRDVARLQVLEVWKGSAGADVSVTFTRGLICPAPPRYVPGETVLAFLESGPTRLASLGTHVPADEARQLAARWADHWFTVGLSYGTLYPGAEDRPFLRDLVEDALVLQSRSPVPESEWRAWHVRAASQRATRWQGLYALDRSPDEVLASYDRKDRRRTVPTADERRDVMRGFIVEPSDDHTLAMTVAFAGRQPEAEFDRAVLGQVERLLAEQDIPYWLTDALTRMAERHGSRNGRRDLGLKDDWQEPNARSLRVAWARTRDRYGIPEVPPAPAPPSGTEGVAGSSPD
jgi:hypothetical protein